MKRIMIIILATTLLLLSACDFLPKYETPIAPETVARYLVPFEKFDGRWTRAVLLEEDELGRRLYVTQARGVSYDEFKDLSEKTAEPGKKFYLIVQKEDDEYAYCYEETCFLFVSSYEPESEEVRQFKEKNSWGQPLREDKMIKLRKDHASLGVYAYNTLLPGDFEDYHEADKAYTADLKNKVNGSWDYVHFDTVFTADGKPVYIIREVFYTSPPSTGAREWEIRKSYIFTLDENLKVLQYQELIGTPDQWNRQIFTFKQKIAS